MPKYAIAFVSPDSSIVHRIVEMDSRESALKFFFQQFVTQGYTQDAEGFNYFMEDFFDPECSMGSVLEI